MLHAGDAGSPALASAALAMLSKLSTLSKKVSRQPGYQRTLLAEVASWDKRGVSGRDQLLASGRV